MTAATVESTTAMEPAADRSVGYVAAMEAACRSTMADKSVSRVTMSDVATSTVVTASVESAATVKPATVISVIPGTGADEDAVREPVRAIVAVRRACVGIVIIVSIGACGRSADVSWAKSDANADLRLGLDQRKRHQYTEQEKIF